jgi:hypothetical protein
MIGDCLETNGNAGDRQKMEYDMNLSPSADD